MISIKKVNSKEELSKAFAIRRVVFIEEQMVSEPDEFDEFDEGSQHFIAYFNGVLAGAARWRKTGNDAKLERFAVLKEYRQKGIGGELVKSTLQDIHSSTFNFNRIFLHAQIDVIPLYSKFGFEPEGEVFDECNILHQTMVWQKSV